MRLQVGTLVLSAVIAFSLWLMAHGTSSIERSVDIPVVFDRVADDLVITGRSADAVNIRVRGSRAALRNVSMADLEYRIDVSGAKPGESIYEVDVSRIELPRGADIVSRSPSSIEVEMEARGRKALRIRPDLEGEPAEGFAIAEVQVEPQRVWVTGARSDVLRLREVVTETIDVAGISEPIEREVRLTMGSDNVWREESGRVVVRVRVEALPSEDRPGGQGAGRGDAA